MYTAIVNLTIEVHKQKDNKCTGQILSEEEMKNNELSNNMLVSISGATKNDCLTKLKEWVNNERY